MPDHNRRPCRASERKRKDHPRCKAILAVCGLPYEGFIQYEPANNGEVRLREAEIAIPGDVRRHGVG